MILKKKTMVKAVLIRNYIFSFLEHMVNRTYFSPLLKYNFILFVSND